MIGMYGMLKKRYRKFYFKKIYLTITCIIAVLLLIILSTMNRNYSKFSYAGQVSGGATIPSKKYPVTIIYNSNEGYFNTEGVTTNEVVYEWYADEYHLASGEVITPTRDNYDFKGWYLDVDGLQEFSLENKFADLVLNVFAIWESNSSSTPIEDSFAGDLMEQFNADPVQTNYVVLDDGTDDSNSRYVVNNPDNWVKIDDLSSTEWRVLGVFNNIDDGNGNKETRVKVFKFNYTSSSYDNISKLNTNTKYLSQYFGPAVFHVGGINSLAELETMSAYDIYNAEHSSNLTVTATIGSITLSDYAFAGFECIAENVPLTQYSTCGASTHNMLYRGGSSGLRLFNKDAEPPNTVFYVNGGNVVDETPPVNQTRMVLAVAYLKANVKMSSGTGTKEDPWLLTFE